MDGHETYGDAPPTQPYIPVARPCGPDYQPVDGALPGPVAPVHPMLLPACPREHALLDIAKLLGVVALIWVTVQAVWVAVEVSGFDVDRRWANVLLTLTGAFIMVAATILLSRRQPEWPASLGLHVGGWGMTFLFGLVAMGAAYVSMFCSSAAMALLYPKAVEAMQRNQEQIVQMLPKLHPLLLALLSLSVGIYEELICRGFLLTRLRRATGSVAVAVIVSSLMFAVPHAATQELFTLVPLFVMGCAWAAMTWWLKSVVPAMIGHAVFDLCNLLALYFLSPDWT